MQLLKLCLYQITNIPTFVIIFSVPRNSDGEKKYEK